MTTVLQIKAALKKLTDSELVVNHRKAEKFLYGASKEKRQHYQSLFHEVSEELRQRFQKTVDPQEPYYCASPKDCRYELDKTKIFRIIQFSSNNPGCLWPPKKKDAKFQKLANNFVTDFTEHIKKAGDQDMLGTGPQSRTLNMLFDRVTKQAGNE